MTFWNGIGIGFCGGVFTTLTTMPAYALCSVSEPDVPLPFEGEALRKMDDAQVHIREG